MNNKKIIFLAILWFFAIIIVVIVFLMSSSTNNNKKQTDSNNFKIWILNDNKESFMSFVEDFKKNTSNTSFSPKVESFDNYEEYNNALASAIIKWEAPDLYMLNNNEKSIFLENAVWINPEIISPDDLRTYFKPFFGDDLILSSWEEDNKTEFLVWVPFWFETLWIYFSLSKIADVKKLKSFSDIKVFINDFHDSKPWLTVFWIWRWNTVINSSDIIAQFFMSEWIKSIYWINSSDIKTSVSEYFNYSSWDNNYALLDKNLKEQWENNLDAFSRWDVAMIFWYPRNIHDIDEKWFSKRTLRATNFPDFFNESEKLANYNYFVINKNSKNMQIANEFLKYLFSEEWQLNYLEKFKYYIPARVSVYSDLKDLKIHDDYHIKLNNFYNLEATYSSFDKWIKSNFDLNLPKMLDEEINYLDNFTKFFSKLACKSNKIIKLENLSESCE